MSTDNLSIRKSEQFCCWTQQIREHVAFAKSLVPRGETESSSVPLVNGIPDYLAGIRFDGWWLKVVPPSTAGLPRRTPGRREAVSLVGKSIVPLQAAIALMRVQFLANLVQSIDND